MFCKVLSDMGICKKVLDIVLDKEIPRLVTISPQEPIENGSDVKSTRLDILAKDEYGNHYNIEMQMVNNDCIAKRMRFYQASIDVRSVPKSVSYTEMKNTIIIFFCMFDPIGEGLPIYTFENFCRENKDIALKDGTLKIIINVKAYDAIMGKDKLKALLKYIYDSVYTDSFTEVMDMKLDEIKQDLGLLTEYMSFYAAMCDERKEGRKEERHNIARIMKGENCPLSLIVKTTGLSKEQIESL